MGGQDGAAGWGHEEFGAPAMALEPPGQLCVSVIYSQPLTSSLVVSGPLNKGRWDDVVTLTTGTSEGMAGTGGRGPRRDS